MVHRDPVTVQYLKAVANYEQSNGGEEGVGKGSGGRGARGGSGSVLKKRKRNSAAAGARGGLPGTPGMLGIDGELERLMVRATSSYTSDLQINSAQ